MSTIEVVEALNDLLQVEYDAIGAYEVAMDDLGGSEHAEHLELFRRHHERHVQELNRQIQALGGSPVNEPHATGSLHQALQGLGALAGDRGTLMAFRTNELQIRARYADCVARAVNWPPGPRGLVERHAVDEERHVRWVIAALDRRQRLASGGDPAAENGHSGAWGLTVAALFTLGLGVGLLLGRRLR